MGVPGRRAGNGDLTVSLGAVGRGVSLQAKKRCCACVRPSMRVRWKLVGRDLRPGPFGLHHVRHQQRGAGGVQRHAAALGRRCLCGCDDGTQLGAGDYHNARHGHYQCRAARHRLQFWRRRIQTRAFRHSIHECGLRWVHSRRMAVPVFVPGRRLSACLLQTPPCWPPAFPPCTFIFSDFL